MADRTGNSNAIGQWKRFLGYGLEDRDIWYSVIGGRWPPFGRRYDVFEGRGGTYRPLVVELNRVQHQLRSGAQVTPVLTLRNDL